MFEVIIDNVSNMEYGMVIEHRPTIPAPKRKMNSITIPGRHGSLTEFESYEDKQISLEFVFVDDDNIPRKIRSIMPWLTNAKILKFSDDREMFYKIKHIVIGDVERELRVIGRFKIEVIVDPFIYLEENISEGSSELYLYNNGSYTSEPNIKVYGNGDITLFVNDSSISLKDVDEYVEIDSLVMQCHKGNINKNNKMIGDFPILKTGDNTITCSGDVTKIEVIPRWRCV